MTDLDSLARWSKRYVEAWRSNDAETIGALFTDDAVYRWHPFDKSEDVARGRDAIVRAWLEEPDDPESWELTAEPIAVGGDLGVIRAVTAYGGDEERTYHNIFLVHLNDEGRCFDFTEYFMREPDA